jgi:hypothetical protein
MAGGAWSNDQLRTLTLPPGAGSTDSRIVIGPDLPVELTNYYGLPSAPFGIVAAIIYYSPNINSYWYDGALNGAGNNTVRGYVLNGTVMEMARRAVAGAGIVRDWYGYDSTTEVNMVFGANGGGGTGTFAFQTGPLGGLLIHGNNVCASQNKINQDAGNGNTTSLTYVNLPGSPSFSFVKNYAAARTKVEVFIATSCFASVVNSGVDFAVQINGVDTKIAHGFLNPASQHQYIVGMGDVTGLANGTYTVTPRWKSAAGNQLNQDGNDRVSVRAREVPV